MPDFIFAEHDGRAGTGAVGLPQLGLGAAAGSSLPSRGYLKGLSQRLEIGHLLPLQFGPDLLETLDDLLCIQPLTTVKTDFRPNGKNGGMDATTKQFLHIFFNHLTTTYRALREGDHL